MNLPPPRVREVLSVLRDLRPDEARALLAQVVATLDAAEVLALRAWLPPAAVHCLPSCVGAVPTAGDALARLSEPASAVTVMNEAPMPWELKEPPSAVLPVEPPVARLLPRSRRRLIAIAAAAACALTLTGLALWATIGPATPKVADAQPTPHLVPLPPEKTYAPMPPPIAARAKKVIAKSAPRKPARTASRNEPADWASPFEHRQ